MNPTSQTACQQLAEDETPTNIPPPPEPVMDLDAALSEVPTELPPIFSLLLQRKGQYDIVGHHGLQRLHELSQIHDEQQAQINSLVTPSPKSLHNPHLSTTNDLHGEQISQRPPRI
uniref:Uncharacterized protein n=1 Tax=Brassica campestris TaxID=3711 RepID=M4EEE2_BRACM